MTVLTLLALVAWTQAAAPAALDVSALTIGPPAIVAELDLGKLKGEPRRLAWAPDGSMLYLQTAEGNPPSERLRHYTIGLGDGRVSSVEAEPEWAAAFWAVKQDRVAPGVPGLSIEIAQNEETLKATASAGALDRTGSPESAGGTLSADSGSGTQKAHVVRLTLLGQEIGAWVNERVIPGLRFGWGPPASGAIVFVGEGGRLVFFDRQKRKQVAPDVRNASLPAWSSDGTRVACLTKAGRKKYLLCAIPVAAQPAAVSRDLPH